METPPEMVVEVIPCFIAFWEERILPSAVRGPVDLAALARLAARRSSEVGITRLLEMRIGPWRQGAGANLGD